MITPRNIPLSQSPDLSLERGMEWIVLCFVFYFLLFYEKSMAWTMEKEDKRTRAPHVQLW